jgi:hypothetical protein
VRAFPPTSSIKRVEFYKIDELTADLICCQIVSAQGVDTFHEESAEWPALLSHLAGLDGFDAEWFGKVSQPPFAECRHTAYSA